MCTRRDSWTENNEGDWEFSVKERNVRDTPLPSLSFLNLGNFEEIN